MAAIEKRPRRPAPKGATLTKALGTKIVKTHAGGVSKLVAARAHGVTDNTVAEWVRRGEGRDDRPPTPLMTWFAAEMRKAEAQFIESLAVAIVQDDDWHAKAWTLERRFPEEYGRPADRLEITGQGGGAIRVELAFDTSGLVEAVNARRALSAASVIDIEGVEET